MHYNLIMHHCMVRFFCTEEVMLVVCIPDEDEDFDEYKLTLTLVIENDQIKEIKDISGDLSLSITVSLAWT